MFIGRSDGRATAGMYMALFSDFEVRRDHLIAKDTGARIPLTAAFFLDLARGASFVWLIQALKASRLIKGRAARARIAFFPKKPRSYYAIWPVCQLADVKIVDDPGEADLLFYFEDREFLTGPHAAPAAAALSAPVLNGACFDIRKSQVARSFEETFGYSLAVDPRTWTGPAVEKSELNGKHDGRIVQCPLREPRRDRVYQRLVDNTFDGSEFIDIRTPVVGGRIPFVYLKRRTRANRFSNENRRVDMATPEALFSRAEIEKIAAFTRASGLDFGGLDILRDRTDGRIYIVDVNKTDMGPPTALSVRGKLTAMRGLASAFAALIDTRVRGGPDSAPPMA